MEMITLDEASGTVDMIVGALELALEGLEAETAEVIQEKGKDQKICAVVLAQRISNLYGPAMDLVYCNLRDLQDQLSQATA